MFGEKFNKFISVLGLMIMSIPGQAHDTDGFYVIPTGKVITKEVCNGTPIGNETFTIVDAGSSVFTGDTYSTSTGFLVEITGITNGGFGHTTEGSASFRVSPDALPAPTQYGVKGPYYFLSSGNIIYSRFL